MPPQLLSLYDRFLRQWLFLGAVLTILGATVAGLLYQDHERLERTERERLRAQAQVIDISLVRQLDSVYHALLSVRADFLPGHNSPPSTPRLVEKLNDLSAVIPAVNTIIILDAGGNVVATNQTEILAENFSYRDYFIAPQRHPNPDTVYVSPPFRTVMGIDGLSLTLMIPDARGRFAGIVTAILDRDFFAALINSALYAPDMSGALAHGGGLQFLMVPDQPGQAGKNLAQPGSFFSRHQESREIENVLTGPVYATGEERIMALRTIKPAGIPMDYPLVVTVGRDLTTVYAPWRRDARIQWLLYGVLSIGSLLGLNFHQRRKRIYERRTEAAEAALRQTEIRYQKVVEDQTEIISRFRADGTLTFVSETFCNLFGKSQEQILGSKWPPIAVHEDMVQIQAQLATLSRQNPVVTIENRVHTGTGSVRWMQFANRGFFDTEGKLLEIQSVGRDITERKMLEAQLQTAQEELRDITNSIPVAVYRYRSQEDGRPQFLYVSERVQDLWGMSAAQAMADPMALFSRIHGDDRERFLTTIQASAGKKPCAIEYRIVLPDGQIRWLHADSSPKTLANGLVVANGFIQDVTERVQFEERLKLAASVFDHSMQGVLITDSQALIIDCNSAFTQITGYSREEALGRNPNLLKSDMQSSEFYTAMWESIINEGFWRGEIWNRRKDGTLFPALLTISTVHDDRGGISHYVGVFTDISTLKENERKLERIAHYDALTDIPNRVLLADHMEMAIAQTKRTGKLMAVCYLDLDGFKPVNDTWGHDAGDQLLVEMAHRLKGCLRGGDTVARLGGDEFVLLLLGLEDEEECKNALHRILEAINCPFTVANHPVSVGASIGVTLYPLDQGDADTLLRQADRAMYLAKQSGRNHFRFFSAI